MGRGRLIEAGTPHALLTKATGAVGGAGAGLASMAAALGESAHHALLEKAAGAATARAHGGLQKAKVE